MYKERKIYQRKFNKLIKKLNQSIVNDNLWKGRFEFRQKDASFEWFPDNSGGILYVIIRGYDKATGYYKDFNIEYAPYFYTNGWKLWSIVNNFIVDDAKVWEENPRPSYETAYDYSHMHINNAVMALPYNYHLSNESLKERVWLHYVRLCNS